jgi:hypothetical protein
MTNWGFNLRTTMLDRDDALFEAQMGALYTAKGRAIYYAVGDDEFDWFPQLQGLDYQKRLYRWCNAHGVQVIHPIVDSNVGVENAVSSSIWSQYLSDRDNYAVMARKDLISAIIRTKHKNGWDWLLQDCTKTKSTFTGISFKGAIGVDLMAFHTDAWTNLSVPMNWARLTPAGKAKIERLGPIAPGNPFVEFKQAAELILGTSIIGNGCFVYDEGNGPRVTSMYGSITDTVLEFGVRKTVSNPVASLRNIFTMIRNANVTRALLHTPIDPSLAWYWKNLNGTAPLWSDSGYAASGGNNVYTCWPVQSMRTVILQEMAK